MCSSHRRRQGFRHGGQVQDHALQDLAFKKFEVSVPYHWKHKEFARAVNVIYTSTPADFVELRKLAVDTMDAYLHAGILTEEMNSELCTLPSFAYDVLKRCIPEKPCDCGHDYSSHRRRLCKGCDVAFAYCDDCGSDEPGWPWCGKCTGDEGSQFGD